MQNQTEAPVEKFDSFDGLFEKVENRLGYWVELGKLDFTEEMLGRMKQLGVSKGEMAERLGAKPSFISRLVSGNNNFTIETMVRVARALDCEFRCHLQPAGTKTCWIDVLNAEPSGDAQGWGSGVFKKMATVHPDFANGTLAAAA